MNVISSTKLRNNLAESLKKIKKEKYLLISQRSKIKWGIIDIDYLKELLAKVDNSKLKVIEELKKEFEEVYK